MSVERWHDRQRSKEIGERLPALNAPKMSLLAHVCGFLIRICCRVWESDLERDQNRVSLPRMLLSQGVRSPRAQALRMAMISPAGAMQPSKSPFYSSSHLHTFEKALHCSDLVPSSGWSFPFLHIRDGLSLNPDAQGRAEGCWTWKATADSRRACPEKKAAPCWSPVSLCNRAKARKLRESDYASRGIEERWPLQQLVPH